MNGLRSAALISLLFAASDLCSQVPFGERQALIDFYHATGGEDWALDGAWLGPVGTECDWPGVWCVPGLYSINGQMAVAGLFLPNAGLVGTVPDGLERLRFLLSLNLEGNRLAGSVDVVMTESIRELRLADNRFTGELPDSLPSSLRFLDVSRNRLTGAVPQALLQGNLQYAALSHNQLHGDLPVVDAPSETLARLFLDNNQLTGRFPESWHLLPLTELDLGNNLLEGIPQPGMNPWPFLRRLTLRGNRFHGSVEAALEGIVLNLPVLVTLNLSGNDLDGALPDTIDWPRQLVHIDLAFNRLEGEIGEAVEALEYLHPSSSSDFGGPGGLHLCWNSLHPATEEVAAFVLGHHYGGDPELCTARTPVAPTLAISGSWYDPARSGEGLTLSVLPSGEHLVYWFGFDEEGGQRWWLGVTTARDRDGLFWESPVTEPAGRFGQGSTGQYTGQTNGDGTFEYSLVDGGRMISVMSRAYPIVWPGPLVGPLVTPMPPPKRVLQRLEQRQLTRLAGTACEHRQPHQWISGAWRDPARSGEGFVVEVTEDGRGVVYWFTYRPDDSGEQAWMMGAGEFAGNVLHIDDVIQPVGGGFGPDFDPDTVERVHWGSLTLEFTSYTEAQVEWGSVFDDYGSGRHTISRLTRPALADCD